MCKKKEGKIMNKRLIFCLLFMLLSFLMFPIFSFAQTTIPEERITIITYYPAPFGVYNRLVTRTLGVGDTNASGDIDIDDAPDPTDLDKRGQALIANGLGIGTTNASNYLLSASYTNSSNPDGTFLLVSGNSGARQSNDTITFGHTDGNGGTNMEIFGSYGKDGNGTSVSNSIYYDAERHYFRATDSVRNTYPGANVIITSKDGSGSPEPVLQVIGKNIGGLDYTAVFIADGTTLPDGGEAKTAGLWFESSGSGIPGSNGGGWLGTGTYDTAFGSDMKKGDFAIGVLQDLHFVTTPKWPAAAQPQTTQMIIKREGNVGIGTTDPKAVLDITSTTSGFVPPRMAKNKRDAIPNPAEGSLIYNTDDDKFNYHDAFSWKDFGQLSGGFCVLKRTGHDCPSWAPTKEGPKTIGFFSNLDDSRTGDSGHGYQITVCCGP